MRLGRLWSGRVPALPLVIIGLLTLLVLCSYWSDYRPQWNKCQGPVSASSEGDILAQSERERSEDRRSLRRSLSEGSVAVPFAGCPVVSTPRPSTSLIDTVDIYPQLDFQVNCYFYYLFFELCIILINIYYLLVIIII